MGPQVPTLRRRSASGRALARADVAPGRFRPRRGGYARSRLLDLACRHAARGTEVVRTKVLCYRTDKGDLLMVAGVGWKPGLVGHARLAIDMASPPGRCWQTGHIVRCGDLLVGPGFRREGMLKDEGIARC